MLRSEGQQELLRTIDWPIRKAGAMGVKNRTWLECEGNLAGSNCADGEKSDALSGHNTLKGAAGLTVQAMASGAEVLSLLPLSAERPLRTSVASHLVPQASSTTGEALSSSRSVESDFFRFDCSDGKKLYPLLLSDSPTRELTGDLPNPDSLGLEDDLYLLTHSFPPPGSPGMQKSLSGR